MATKVADVITPSDILNPGLQVQGASYIDINPTFDPHTSPSLILLDTYAIVHGSLANLFVSAQGTRSRIFQEDYWSGLYQLLQEPFDSQTADLIAMAAKTAVRNWEPRITNVSVSVVADTSIPGYAITVYGQLISAANQQFSASYSLPV
jgi:phage baseplate assembly protein W